MREQDYWPAIEQCLTQHGLRRVGTDKYRSNAPYRTGSNSGALSLSVDAASPGGGKFFDHVDELGGSFIKLAILLGLKEDDGYAAPSTSLQTYESLEDYEQYQIGEQCGAFAAARWSFGEKYCGTRKARRPALIFPTRTGERWRYTDGMTPKYGHAAGYQSCWYGVPGAKAVLAANDGASLVLCNGPSAVVTAQHYGVPAICISGGGERAIPEPLMQQLGALLKETGTASIIIALDCDETGRRAAQKVLGQISAANWSARAVDLQGGRGFDLANFCKLHKGESLYDLDALPDAPPPAPRESIDDLRVEIAELRAQVEQWQEVAYRQQQQVQELKAQMQAAKEVARWESDIIAGVENVASPTVRMTLIALRKILAYDLDEAARHDGWVHVPLGRLAEMAGISTALAGKHLQKLKDSGIIEVKKETMLDESKSGDGVWTTTLYVRERVDLSNAKAIVIPSLHGGKREPRRCTDCGSVHLVTKHQEICHTCGAPQGEPTYTEVKSLEDVAAEEAAGGPPEEWAGAVPMAGEDDLSVAESEPQGEIAPGLVRVQHAAEQGYLLADTP
jgi:hypothetical protein